jgi:predicted nucleic acid-binding protein
MTEAELEQWILLAQWGRKPSRTIPRVYDGFVSVPSSRDLVMKWAEVMVSARRTGRRIEAPDAWIAATALLCGASLVTHNPKDYLGAPKLKLHISQLLGCDDVTGARLHAAPGFMAMPGFRHCVTGAKERRDESRRRRHVSAPRLWALVRYAG